MDAAVERVLAEREGHARRGAALASLTAAILLHVAVAVLIVLGPRFAPPPAPLDYVAVQVVPAQRLGSEPRERRTPPERRPPAPPRQETPPPPTHEEPPAPPRSNDAPVLHQAPPPAPAKPAKQPKPKPAPPDNRVDPTTQPKILPPPREVLARKLAAMAPPAPPAPSAPGAPPSVGAATGTLTGKAAVGSSITAFDNPDFTYDYYIAQLVALIDKSWVRPPVGPGVRAIVSFRIQRDGSISDVTMRLSSSIDVFDLAALRAVQNAAPFPPLPRAYTLNHDSVGVNVTIR